MKHWKENRSAPLTLLKPYQRLASSLGALPASFRMMSRAGFKSAPKEWAVAGNQNSVMISLQTDL